MMAKKQAKIYQLKIVLEGSKPPIWRRVLVNGAENLVHLHWVIQVAMGWENSHLHQLIHNGQFYSEPSPFDDGATLPRCVTGKMACPPEDVGGIWGYADFVAVMADKKHPEHEEMLEWTGLDEFDPAAFDVAEVNSELLGFGG